MAWFDELKVALRYHVDDRELSQTNKKLREHRNLVRGASQAAAAIGVASTVALGVAGRQLIEWDRVQNMIRATLADKATEEQFKALARYARDLARDVSKTPEETALAQLELARAGLTFNEVMAATPQVVNLAIAAQMNMADVSRLVIATARAYNIEISESERIVDGFAQTARNSLFSVHEFQAAMRHAFPLAGALGLPFEETLAFMAAMREGGLAPEMVGTAMRNQIARLLNMTNQQKNAFSDMGLAWQDVQLKVSEGRIIEVFDEMLAKGVSIIEMEAIFENRALAGGLIAMRSLDHIRELGATIRDGTGATREMRIEMESRLFGAYKKMISAAQEFMLSLGDAGLTQVLTIVFQGLRAVANIMSQMPGPLRTAIVLTLLLGSSMVFVAVALRAWLILLQFGFTPGMVKAAARSIAWSLSLSGPVVSSIVAATAATWAWVLSLAGPLVGALMGAVAATWAWTIALLANPAVLVVLAVLALVAVIGVAVYALIKWGGHIIGFFEGVWQTVRDGAEALFGWLIDGLKWVGNAIGNTLGWLLGGGGRTLIEATIPITQGVSGFAGGRGFGPTVPPLHTERTGSVYNEHNMNIDKIEVNAPGGDPADIASKIGERLEEKNKIMVAQFDTGVSG